MTSKFTKTVQPLAPSARLAFVVVFSIFPAVCSQAQTSRIAVNLSTEEIDEVTFDPSRASETDVRRWILLSKDGQYSEASASFSPCPELQQDQRPSTIEAQKVSAQKFIAEIDETKFPPELSPIVDYLKHLRPGWYWIDTREVDFMREKDMEKLKEPYDGVDPAIVCASAIRKILTGTNDEESAKAVCFDWGNCMNDALYKKLGPYPTAAWEKFLAAYGIQETIRSTVE